MRYRAMGILVVLSGVFFVAGVPDPPIVTAWGGSATDVMARRRRTGRHGSPRPG